MSKTVLIYGGLICAMVAFANWRGWRMLDFNRSGGWAPGGQSMYHK